jgi:hypothetical protein
MNVESKNGNLLFRMGVGDFGLFSTFWFFGVVAQAIFVFLFFVLFRVDNTNISTNSLFIVYLTYSMIYLFGLWDASSRYKGFKLWPLLGKILTVALAIGLVIGAIQWIS